MWVDGKYEFNYVGEGNYLCKALIMDSNQLSTLDANKYCIVRCNYPFDPEDDSFVQFH